MNLEIPELSLVALVGPSGSGKSTFDDHCLLTNAALLLPISLVYHLAWASCWTATFTSKVRRVGPTLATRCRP